MVELWLEFQTVEARHKTITKVWLNYFFLRVICFITLLISESYAIITIFKVIKCSVLHFIGTFVKGMS